MNVLVLVFVLTYISSRSHGSSLGRPDDTSHDESLIMGGIPVTNPHQFPSVVPITIFTLGTGKIHCTGTILSVKFVLTAAHCLIKELTYIRITVAYELIKRRSYYTTVYHIHPKYQTWKHDYDIGVAEYKTNIILNNKTTAAIVLPEPGTRPEKGTIVAVAGWGKHNESMAAPTSAVLEVIPLAVVDQEKCESLYRWTEEITPRMMCIGYVYHEGKGVCFGDSGGPAIHIGVQVGIVSWSEGCGRKGKPGVFTDVGALRSWLQSVIGF